MAKQKEESLLPTKEMALKLLRKLRTPISVRRHSIRVAKKAIQITNKIKNSEINRELVVVGALLHDIGRSKTHGFEHALIGGKILRNRGYPPQLARICETHLLGGLDKEDALSVGLPEKDYIPETLEEKIVCLADKHMAGTKEVSIKERFDKWFEKYGKSSILLKSKKRVEEIQKELYNLM